MSNVTKRFISALIAGGLFSAVFFIGPALTVIFLVFLCLYMLLREWHPIAQRISPVLSVFLSLYLVIAMIFFSIYAIVDHWIVFLLCMVAWVADTAAYASGKLWGVHRICPHISPGKTWEGLAGGIIATFGYFYLLLPVPYILLWSILVAGAGFLGDITISYAKRKAGLKDTGRLLPGHGGLLDRFDSVFGVVILMTIVFFFFCCKTG